MDRPPLLYDASTASKLQALVGRTVLVLWPNLGGKDTFVEAQVTAHDTTTGKHAVEYADGGVILYAMSRKTFRIKEEGFTYKPWHCTVPDDAGEVVISARPNA